MGVNLIPLVRKFRIETKKFAASDCAMKEGCIDSAGTRKLLRFDFLCWNAGDKELKMGAPSQNPQLYEFSPCHQHFHLKQFNGYKIYDCKGNERKGNKQAFCLEDSEKISAGPASKKFNNCNSNQGISAGWADLYGSGLDCQWIDVTGLPDGEYVVEARTNRNGVVKEDWYGDNFTWAGIKLTGNTVKEIPPPCYPEDCIGINPVNVQAKNVGGSWKVVDGTHWIMDFKTKDADAKRARDVIKFYGMTRICYVGRPSPTGKQLMMYFKVGSGVPNGPFAGEDALPFSNANVQAKQVGGRWTVVDGNHLMINFEASEANCRKAVWLIKKYGFNFICFVGRPNPPMMYFRKQKISGAERAQRAIAELAKEVGLSRSTLVERFTRYLSDPPMTYLIRWRLQLAARALASTPRGVAEIVADVGYESESAFNRAFKREFDSPPARYRREHRAANESTTG